MPAAGPMYPMVRIGLYKAEPLYAMIFFHVHHKERERVAVSCNTCSSIGGTVSKASFNSLKEEEERRGRKGKAQKHDAR